MKLWKQTVALMLATLLGTLVRVGGLGLYIIGERNLTNAASTYARQMNASASMLEQFWDSVRYAQMTEVGRRSYREFQFRLCCGEGFILIDDETGKAAENLTAYNLKDVHALDLTGKEAGSVYRLQKIKNHMLLLQRKKLISPEGYSLLSIRDISEIFQELLVTGLWFLGICSMIFFLAGIFIWKMMRRTLRRMEELQEVAGKQEMLLGALSHEMKTPLTSIIGYSDTLRAVNLSGEQKDRALEHISREGKRLEALSAKMLQMLGLHRNDAIEKKPCSVQEIFRRIVQLEEKKADMLLLIKGEDFIMEMDQALMESLLLNLMDNAIKASESGKAIILNSGKLETEKYIQVRDFGRGIPEEELDKIKEPFYMVDKSRSRQQGGAGLGLALCVKIAELHKGRLEIKSREGKGTCVTVYFPLK